MEIGNASATGTVSSVMCQNCFLISPAIGAVGLRLTADSPADAPTNISFSGIIGDGVRAGGGISLDYAGVTVLNLLNINSKNIDINIGNSTNVTGPVVVGINNQNSTIAWNVDPTNLTSGNIFDGNGNTLNAVTNFLPTFVASAVSGGYLTWPSGFTLRALSASGMVLGGADVASPSVKGISTYGVLAGTLNQNGANLNISGSASTGAGLGGSIVLRTTPPGSSGSTQNAVVAALTVDGYKNTTFSGVAVLNGYTVATLPSTGPSGRTKGAKAYVTDATSCTFLGSPTGGGSTFCPVIYNGSAWVAD